jgi:hypothetical protein
VPEQKTEHRIGLRFRRSMKAPLRNLVERMKSEGIDPEHISLFEQAAEAARTGEPLIVICAEPMEAELMAAAFPAWGIVKPNIEQLSLV